MSNEIQSINQRIAERVGHELVDLIPPEQWQEMIDSQVERFKREIFPRVVEEELIGAVREKIKREIDDLLTLEWSELANRNVYPRLREFLGQSGGEVFAAVLSPAMQQVLTNLRNQLMNGY